MIKAYTKDTLTREVLKRGVKLRVIDAEHSAAFQKACFNLGIFWLAGPRHVINEDSRFIYAYRNGLTCSQTVSAPLFRDADLTEIRFNDGRYGVDTQTLSSPPDTQFNKAYTINFSKQGCIDTVIDDGRPAFQRLRELGVLFDSKQDAQRWLDNHIEGEKWLI